MNINSEWHEEKTDDKTKDWSYDMLLQGGVFISRKVSGLA